MTICGAVFVLMLVADFFGYREAVTWQMVCLVVGHLAERVLD